MNSLRHLLLTSIRADRSAFARYDLAPPEVRPNGSVVYEAVLASPGVSDYPELGITERTTADALRDPAWLAGLAGLPIIDDPDLHWRGVTLDDLPDARIGSILDARWDDAQQVAIVRLVMDTARGLDLVRRGVRGLSVTYTPESRRVEGDPDGATHVQTRRHTSDHVLLTGTPRDIAARIRADATGGSMTPEQIAALKAQLLDAVNNRADSDAVAPLVTMLVDARADAAAATQRADGLQSEMDALKAAPAPEPEPAPRADAWREAFDVAAKVGVEVKPDASLDDVRRSVVAKHLPKRADAKGDALDVAFEATVASLAAAPKPEAGDVWRRRADANGPVTLPSSDADAAASALTL